MQKNAAPDLPEAVVLALQAEDTGRFYTVEELARNEFILKEIGMIGLISGKLKPSEKPRATMVREANEEGGFCLDESQIVILSKRFVFRNIHPVPVTIGYATIPNEISGVSADPEVRPNGWMSMEELLAFDWQNDETRPETRVVLNAVRVARGVLVK